jgi:hypothetical protein
MTDTSLKAITSHVRRHIECFKLTTHGTVADAVVAGYRDSTEGAFPEHTLRRRIYDVITVFCVIGYVQKVDKTLVWIGELSRGPSPFLKDIEQATRRIQSKEQVLQYKMRLFLGYQSLIAANRGISKPSGVLSFPAIVLGRRGPSWTVRPSPPSTQLTIDADVIPDVISPFDIVSCRPFNFDVIDRARLLLPSSPLVEELLPA